jgi:tRNA (cmo5U34)-methyltransferase
VATDTEQVVGDGIAHGNAAWSFAGQTAAAFGDHVRRSVPMYDLGHELIARLSDFFVRQDSYVYDVGTSLGGALERVVERHGHQEGCSFVGIDTEPDMVRRARDAFAAQRNVTIEEGDLLSYEFEKSDLIISYYCLQFMPPKHRQDAINKIHEHLNWGGAFIWFEKVRGCDARFQDIFNLLYVDYKLEQSYTPEEIVGKSRSLKGVLEPFSSEGNRALLERAGFLDTITVFKYLCFEGILAIK